MESRTSASFQQERQIGASVFPSLVGFHLYPKNGTPPPTPSIVLRSRQGHLSDHRRVRQSVRRIQRCQKIAIGKSNVKSAHGTNVTQRCRPQLRAIRLTSTIDNGTRQGYIFRNRNSSSVGGLFPAALSRSNRHHRSPTTNTKDHHPCVHSGFPQ